MIIEKAEEIIRAFSNISTKGNSIILNNKSPMCPSMSTFGSQERQKYATATFAVVSNPKDAIIPATDAFFAKTYVNEEAMNDDFFETLVSLTASKDLEDGIIVVNSERTL